MGVVHPIHIIATVDGRRRCIACIEIPGADPDSSTIIVVSRILALLKKNPRYVALDLAYAEHISEDEWERDADAEFCIAVKQERQRHGETQLLDEKILELEKELEKERLEAQVPRFPFIQTCLYIGASTITWDSGSIHKLCARQWNAPPDWGGKYMWEPGCTIIDITDYSYAMILPANQSCGVVKREVYRNLRLRPLDGHDWLRGSGEEDEHYPDRDRVWIEEGDEPAPVTSIDAIREVWPSFPPAAPSVDSDNDDSGDRTNAADDDDDENKSENGKGGGETAPELRPQVNIEGSPEHPELETEQQGLLRSRKRKRDAEPSDDERRLWNTIERLMVSCTPKSLGILKRHENYRSLLKCFMDKHPERFAPKHPGAVPLILAAFINSNTGIKDLDLHQFRDLSGNQVVELVKGAMTHNASVYKGAPRGLKILDISFNRLVGLNDIVGIVAETTLDELIIWHNPGLSLKDIAQISKGRIAKVTTRTGFLTPLKNFAGQSWRSEKSLVPYNPAPPIVSPMPVRIRQVIWMMLGTTNVDPPGLRPDLANELPIPEGKLSLEAIDLDTLAVLLHPRCHNWIYDDEDKNKAHARLVALPHHDAWVSLAEFYTSIARFEMFMSNKQFIDEGYDILAERWTLAFSLLMALGSEQSENYVTAPFPPEAFSLATRELKGAWPSLPMRGPYPIVQGEYTLVFLREPDYGRLRLGLATRSPEGKLIVQDPETVAFTDGDEKAARAWRRGVGNLPPWADCIDEEEETPVVEKEKRRGKKKAQDPPPYRYRRDTAPLEVEALGKMLAAAAMLSADRKKIEKKILDMIKSRRAT
ncbi:hypothetical protein F5Y08DRAFT_318168 [Xylaria arbuscula]|nr:hypothetical protein F5Y08DRAFT_318168 [Xylaria arbuscula]